MIIRIVSPPRTPTTKKTQRSPPQASHVGIIATLIPRASNHLERNLMAWSQIKSRLLFEMGCSSQPPSFPEAASHDKIARTLQMAMREQSEIGWVNFLRGGISRHWGKAQGIYYHNAQLASNTKSAQTFQSALIRGSWSFFHGKWECCNAVLHDANDNINIERMNQRIYQLCRNPSDLVRPSSLCLFKAFSLMNASSYTHLSSKLGSGQSSSQSSQSMETSSASMLTPLRQISRIFFTEILFIFIEIYFFSH